MGGWGRGWRKPPLPFLHRNTRPLAAATTHTHTHTFSISSDLHYDERSHLCPLVKYTDDKQRGENVRTAGRRRARFLFDDTFSLKYHRFLF